MADRKVNVRLDATSARRGIQDMGQDLDKFQRQLEQLVAEVKVDQAIGDIGMMQDKAERDLSATLDLDTSALKTGQDILDAIDSETVTPKIDPDTSALDRARDAFQKAFDDNPTPKIDVDTSALDAAVNVIADLDGATIRSKFTPETGQLDKLLKDVKSLDRDVQLGVKVNDSELTSIQRRIEELTGEKIEPDLLIGDGNLSEIARQLEGLGDRISPQVDVAVEDSAVDRALRKIEDLDDTVTVDVDVEVDEGAVSGLGERLGGLISGGIPMGINNDAILSKLGGLAVAAGGPLAIGLAIGATIFKGIDTAISNNTENTRLQLRGAFDEATMADIGAAAGKAYTDGFGESYGQLAEQAANMEQLLADIDPQLDLTAATQQVQALATVFDVDVNEAILTTRDLIASGLVKDTEEAFDLLFRSAQELGPEFEEAAEVVREFADDFARAGFDGAEAFGLIQSAVDNKLFPSMDRAGEIFQEFGIRLAAGDISEQVTNLGLDFEDLQTKIADGRGPEALKAVSDALLEIEDVGLRNQLAMEIFGASVEEAADPEAVLTWLSQADAIDDVGGAATDAAEKLRSDLGTQLANIPRKVETALLNAVVYVRDDFVPAFLETFGGVIDKVSEIFTDITDAIVESFTPVVESVVRVFQDELVPRFVEFKDRVSEVFQGLNEAFDEAFGGEGGIVGFITDTLIPAFAAIADFIVTELVPVLVDLYLTYLEGLITAFATLVTVFLDDVLPVLQDLWGILRDDVLPVLEDVASYVTDTLQGAWEDISTLWTDTVAPALETLWEAFQDLLEVAEEVWEGVSGAVETAWEIIEGIYTDLAEALQPITDGWADLKEGAEEAWEGISGAVETAWEIISEIFTSITEALGGGGDGGDGVGQSFLDLSETAQEAWEAISGFIEDAWELIQPILEAIVEFLDVTLTESFTDLQEAIELVWAAILEAIETTAESIGETFTLIGEALTLLGEAFTDMQTTAEEVWAAIQLAIETAWGIIEELWQSIVDFLTVDLTNAFTDMQTTAEQVWQAIQSAIDVAVQAVLGFLQSVIDLLSGGFTTAFTDAQSLAERVWPAISGAVGTAKDAVLGFLGEIAGGISGTFTTAFNDALSLAERVWPGVSGAVDTAKGIIVEALNTAKGVVEELGGAFTSARSAIETAIGGAASFVEQTAGRISTAVQGIISSIQSIPGVPGGGGGGGLTSSSDGPGAPLSTGTPAGASAWGGVHDTPYLTWVGEAMLGKEAIVPEYASLDHIYGLLGQTNILGRIQADMTRRLMPGTMGLEAEATPSVTNHTPVSMQVTIEDRGSSMAAKQLQAHELAAAVRRSLAPTRGPWG